MTPKTNAVLSFRDTRILQIIQEQIPNHLLDHLTTPNIICRYQRNSKYGVVGNVCSKNFETCTCYLSFQNLKLCKIESLKLWERWIFNNLIFIFNQRNPHHSPTFRFPPWPSRPQQLQRTKSKALLVRGRWVGCLSWWPSLRILCGFWQDGDRFFHRRTSLFRFNL